MTTGTAGVGSFEHAFQWGTVATSFAVGIASGFPGYFKYRERTAYLQQTTDATESELEALELGIGRYKNYTKEQEDKALGDFVEEVYRLKSEQKKAATEPRSTDRRKDSIYSDDRVDEPYSAMRHGEY